MTLPPVASPPSPRPPGLGNLAAVPLIEEHRVLLDLLRARAGGSPLWRRRKMADVRDVLALIQISGRLRLEWADVAGDLRLLLDLDAPAPCMPRPDGDLVVGQQVRLGLIYREEALLQPQPGYSFVQVLSPRPIWLASVSPDEHQVLCLGSSLAAGWPVRELILMTYGALTLMTAQFSRSDPAGVMNGAAADWWQKNGHRIPLSREPFIRQPHPKPCPPPA